MDAAARPLIAQTGGWSVSHRDDSALPGYLIVSSRKVADDLSDLSEEALREIGPLLARTQTILKQTLGARRVYIGRYGHISGFTIHFHVIPIYDWVEELFWQDARYRALEQFAEAKGEADGAELTLFVWREFCERLQPPLVKGPTMAEAIDLLCNAMHPRAPDAAAGQGV